MLTNATKKITVVLGSGRSGTSVVAKALQSLGCYLGDDLTPGTLMNPKGFFEDNAIVFEINEKVIESLGCRWHSIPAFECDSSNAVIIELQNKAEMLLEKKFNQASWCGFKDPRTSRLLPFWEVIFQKMALQDSYIFALRNPLSSVASFEKYDELSRAKGFFLWLAHVIPAISYILDKNALVVSYEEILAAPQKQLARIHQGIECAIPMESSAIAEFCEDFLDPALFRNQFTYEELINDHQVPPILIRVYDLLTQVALDKLSLHSTEFKNDWHKICESYHNFMKDFYFADMTSDEVLKNKLLEKNLIISEKDHKIAEQTQEIAEQSQRIDEQTLRIAEQAQFIHELLSSRSWRWTKPIRKLSTTLSRV